MADPSHVFSLNLAPFDNFLFAALSLLTFINDCSWRVSYNFKYAVLVKLKRRIFLKIF